MRPPMYRPDIRNTVGAIVAAVIATALVLTPARADGPFIDGSTHGSAQPDRLGFGTATAEGVVDPPGSAMSTFAEATSTTPVGLNPVGTVILTGASWANGFAQLNTMNDLQPGTYTATARFRVTQLDLSAVVVEPALPQVRYADAYAYLDIVALTAGGPWVEIRELRAGADPVQDLSVVFEVDESGGVFGSPVLVAVALGTVADSRGPARATARAAVHVESFSIERTDAAPPARNAIPNTGSRTPTIVISHR